MSAWQSALWAQAVAALGAAPDRATLLAAALERLAHSSPELSTTSSFPWRPGWPSLAFRPYPRGS